MTMGSSMLSSLPVATVFKLGSHWVPVSMNPVGDALHVFVWDAEGTDHLQLNEVIERVGLAMGFVSVCIQCDKRMFLTSELCGTLAIAYLHHVYLHVQLPATHDETMQRFQMYRGDFVTSLSTCDITRRPWVWAQGDQNRHADQPVQPSDTVPLPVTLTRDQRLDLIAVHHHAVADDEIRFHILHIIDRYYAILNERHREPDVHYLFFELPLVFTCWESIGRTISARWCERNPEVRTQGKQILTAFLLDNHWFPFWIVPKDDCITFHTVAHEVADAQKFRDVCACIGQQLGFPLFALHISPSLLPNHDMCGTFSMMFLAHIVHGARLPETIDTLSTLHTNMRATFVADLYTKSMVPEPVIWGNGCLLWESGLLPIMPCLKHPEPHAQESVLGFEVESSSGAWVDCSSLAVQNFDWSMVHGLVQWHVGCSTLPVQMPDVDVRGPFCDFHLQTRAMDVAEMKFHVERLQVARNASKCPAIPILVLQGLQELSASLRNFVGCQEYLLVQVVLIGNHWVPVVCARCVHVVRVFVPSMYHSVIQPLAVDCPELIVQCVMESQSHNLCGAYAFHVAAYFMCDRPLCSSDEELECLHFQLKHDFALGGSQGDLTGCVGFGAQGTLLKELAAVLVQHGVPASLADDRATDAISVIGSEQILAALKHRQPWRQLKTLGNQKKFKFVLPSELARVVDEKSGKAGGKGQGKHAGKLMPHVDLDPGKLQIVDGIFRAQDKMIPQIHVKQIGPVSSGVILMSLSDAEPYLRSAQCVSSEPLALAVLHRPDAEVNTALPHKQITVPCRCTVDQEPVLADVTLVQIGRGLVEKHKGHDLVELETLDVVTVKYLVYRDELPCDWNDFCKAPIRFLVNTFPLLRRCFDQGCQCDKWHNLENLGIKEPILDVWRRQYLRTGFKPAPMDKAEMFSVCIRVPSPNFDWPARRQWHGRCLC